MAVSAPCRQCRQMKLQVDTAPKDTILTMPCIWTTGKGPAQIPAHRLTRAEILSRIPPDMILLVMNLLNG